MSKMLQFQLRYAECIDVMQTLGENSIDVVVTDPPFPDLKGGYQHTFDGVAKTRRATTSIGVPWSTSLAWITEAKRVSRFGLMIFCSYHSVQEIAEACSDLRKVALLTWYKRNAPPTGKNVPRFTTEFIWCFAKEPGLKWDSFQTTLFDVPNLQAGCMSVERILGSDGLPAHPTQKPILLLSHLLSPVQSGMTVLDPFMGTGTTGIACVKGRHNFIGIESNEKYFCIAQTRINAALAQGDLFAE